MSGYPPPIKEGIRDIDNFRDLFSHIAGRWPGEKPPCPYRCSGGTELLLSHRESEPHSYYMKIEAAIEFVLTGKDLYNA
jgi:hypothetical protein